MFITDRHNKPNTIKFDLLKPSYLLITVLNLLQFEKIDNKKQELSFRRPTDKSERPFATYIAPDQQNNKRARLLVPPHYRSTVDSLFTMNVYEQEPHIAKKLHWVT